MDLFDSTNKQMPVWPEPPEKKCDGLGCIRTFKPKWHTARRCERCKKEKRPYKQDNLDHPF
jgi:hypothetical protein